MGLESEMVWGRQVSGWSQRLAPPVLPDQPSVMGCDHSGRGLGGGG